MHLKLFFLAGCSLSRRMHFFGIGAFRLQQTVWMFTISRRSNSIIKLDGVLRSGVNTVFISPCQTSAPGRCIFIKWQYQVRGILNLATLFPRVFNIILQEQKRKTWYTHGSVFICSGSWENVSILNEKVGMPPAVWMKRIWTHS